MTLLNLPLTTQRKQAKIGMSVALGALVATGLMSGKQKQWSRAMRNLHVLSGVAMVGFSYWHWSLYQDNNTPGRRRS